MRQFHASGEWTQVILLRGVDSLQRDASLSNVALAEKVNVSPPTCLRRVKRLVEGGWVDVAANLPGDIAVIDRLYAALGILDVNAFTTDEATVYLADLPAGRLADWAHIEAERNKRYPDNMHPPGIDPQPQRGGGDK